jgi:hypothetical protein
MGAGHIDAIAAGKRNGRAKHVTGQALCLALVLLVSLCAARSATAAAGAITVTGAAAVPTASVSGASGPATSGPATGSGTSADATTLPATPPPTTVTTPVPPASATSSSPPAPSTPGTTGTSTVTPAPPASTAAAPPSAPATPAPSVTSPATHPCTAPAVAVSGSATTSGSAAASPPQGATSTSAPADASVSCGAAPTVAPGAGAPATTGAVVTGDSAALGAGAPSQPQVPGSTGPAATHTLRPTTGPSAQPGRPSALRGIHASGSDVHRLSRFPSRAAQGERAGGRAPSRPRARQAAVGGARAVPRPATTRGTGATAPVAVRAGGTLTGRRTSVSAGCRPSRKSPMASQPRGAGGHRARSSHVRSSPVAGAPARPNASLQGQGGRPTRGVGVAGPGGTGAPSSVIVMIGFTPVAASWLAGVSGETIHLQFPVTHRLERPG